ncbi:hypothetical protein D3C77_446140 [compost metagenome]
MLGQHVPLTPLAGAHHCALAIYQQTGRAIERTCPDAFALDLRVEGEARRNRCTNAGEHEVPAGCRQAKAYGITEILAGKAQAQTFGLLARTTLDGHFAAAHASADTLGACPEGRFQSAFAGQRIDDAALGGFSEQAQGFVQVGLAAAVGAGDEVQPRQRQHQVIDRAVVGNGQCGQHLGVLAQVMVAAVSPTDRTQRNCISYSGGAFPDLR